MFRVAQAHRPGDPPAGQPHRAVDLEAVAWILWGARTLLRGLSCAFYAAGWYWLSGQHEEPGEEGAHGGQAALSPAADECPLRQLAHGHEGDSQDVAGELAAEGIRGAPAQQRGGDVGIEDDDAHATPARRYP